MQHLKYPIEPFSKPSSYSTKQITNWITEIADFPVKLRAEVDSMSASQLQQTYRPGGWSIIQLVHHCADSHMNSFIRFKCSVTEDKPTIKPYFEELWAELPDVSQVGVQVSLNLLDALHTRWVVLLRSLSQEDLERGYIHPAFDDFVSLKEAISLYAWHCNHHLAHVQLVSK